MTPKQSEQALAKAMKRLEIAQQIVPDRFTAYCFALAELTEAQAEVAEKQAAFVAAHKIQSE